METEKEAALRERDEVATRLDKWFDDMGLGVIEAALTSGTLAEDAEALGVSVRFMETCAHFWIVQKQHEVRDQNEALRAAELKASIDAAKRAAFWTMIAAFVAAVAALANVAAVVIPLMQGKLPDPELHVNAIDQHPRENSR